MPSARKLLERLNVRSKTKISTTKPKTQVTSPSPKAPLPTATAGTNNIAFEKAFSIFVNRLSIKERQAFANAYTAITPDGLFARLTQFDEQDKTTSTRRSYITISRFLRLLNQLINGVAIGAQASPEISSLVVGGAKLIVDLALNFINYFEKLTTMIERLNDHLGHLEEFAKHKTHDLIIDSTANVYGDLLQFYHHAYSVFKDLDAKPRAHLHLRTGVTAQWKPFEEVFGSIDSDIQHHLDVLEHSANVTTLSVVAALNKRGEEELAIRERKELLQWLGAVGFEDVQASTLRKRWPGTAEWILGHKDFKDWLGDPGKTYPVWCNGGPGTGKSVLASVIVDHVQQQLSARNEGSDLVYAYFSYQDSGDRITESTVASLLQQLIRTRDKFPEVVVQTFRDHIRQNKKPVLDTMTAMFCEVAKQTSEIFIVVDALDEYSETERERFFGQFLSQVFTKVRSAKILVTSRPETSIANYLRGFSAREIKTGVKDTKCDIESYVKGQLELSTPAGIGSSRRLQRNLQVQDPKVRDMVIDVLSEKSDGMFLWVDLQLNLLFRQRNEEDVLEVLGSLPRSLNDTYFRVLQLVEEEARPLRSLVVKSLMWAVYGRTDMRLYELREAVVVGESATNIAQLQRARRRYTAADILDACRGLLVSDDDYYRDPLGGWCSTRIIHFSFWQFIMTDDRVLSTDFAVLRDSDAVEYVLALACISHLKQVCLQEGQALNFDELRIRLAGKNTPFAWYCARFFDEHAVTAGVTGDLQLALNDLLSSDESQLAALLQLRHMRRPNYRGDFRSFESGVNARTIIETSRLVEIESIRDDSRWKALALYQDSVHQACAMGRIDQVKNLIDLGADFKTANKYGETPFAIAIMRMHLDIATVLLHAGVDVNQTIRQNETALEISSGTGHEELITLLLESGATGIENNCTFTSSLYDAVWSGDNSVARVLLSRGAKCTESILLCAAQVGMTEVVSACLRSGISPDG